MIKLKLRNLSKSLIKIYNFKIKTQYLKKLRLAEKFQKFTEYSKKSFKKLINK